MINTFAHVSPGSLFAGVLDIGVLTPASAAWRTYVPDPGGAPSYVVDLDAICDRRSGRPVSSVVTMVQSLAASGVAVIVVAEHDSEVSAGHQLDRCGIRAHLVLARAAGDTRGPAKFKHHALHELTRGFRVAAVVESHVEDCAMWRAVGVPVFAALPPR